MASASGKGPRDGTDERTAEVTFGWRISRAWSWVLNLPDADKIASRGHASLQEAAEAVRGEPPAGPIPRDDATAPMVRDPVTAPSAVPAPAFPQPLQPPLPGTQVPVAPPKKPGGGGTGGGDRRSTVDALDLSAERLQPRRSAA